MSRKLMVVAVQGALEQLGFECRARRRAAFARAWNRTEKGK